jgi:hypothetical protein
MQGLLLPSLCLFYASAPSFYDPFIYNPPPHDYIRMFHNGKDEYHDWRIDRTGRRRFLSFPHNPFVAEWKKAISHAPWADIFQTEL